LEALSCDGRSQAVILDVTDLSAIDVTVAALEKPVTQLGMPGAATSTRAILLSKSRTNVQSTHGAA
jgi:hypothetical protein